MHQSAAVPAPKRAMFDGRAPAAAIAVAVEEPGATSLASTRPNGVDGTVIDDWVR
jgi:hypothetical protein